MADLSVTAAQVELVSGGYAVLQAGEAITAGEPIYLKEADGKAWLAITSAQASALVKGIALCDAAAEQQVVYAVDEAVVDLGAGAAVAAGEGYSASNTAGGLQPDADIAASEWVTRLCEGIGSNQVKLLIRALGIQHA